MAKPITEKKNWLLLAGAVLLAGLAFWLTHNYLQNQELRLSESMRVEPAETKRVIVASQPLQEGAVVGPETMSIAEFPASAVSPAAITPQNYREVEGYMIKLPMAGGEPLLHHHIDLPVITRFSQLLYEGERAVSFDIDNLDSISGMMLPGDYIDILVEYEEQRGGGAEPELKIKPLIQRVRVLAVDELPLQARDQENIPYGSHSLKYGSITVAAPYRDAVSLTVAKHSHSIRFLLRNEEDARMVSSSALGGYELFKGANGSGGGGSYRYYSDKNRGQAHSFEITGQARHSMTTPMIRQQLKPIQAGTEAVEGEL